MVLAVTIGFVIQLIIMALLGIGCGKLLAFIHNEYGKGWTIVAAFCVVVLICFTSYGSSKLATYLVLGGV